MEEGRTVARRGVLEALVHTTPRSHHSFTAPRSCLEISRIVMHAGVRGWRLSRGGQRPTLRTEIASSLSWHDVCVGRVQGAAEVRTRDQF